MQNLGAAGDVCRPSPDSQSPPTVAVTSYDAPPLVVQPLMRVMVHSPSPLRPAPATFTVAVYVPDVLAFQPPGHAALDPHEVSTLYPPMPTHAPLRRSNFHQQVACPRPSLASLVHTRETLTDSRVP